MDPAAGKNGILLESGTNEVEFLLFYLGKQPYGINVSKVCHISIFDPSVVRLLPNQRPELLGVFDFRGKTVSIIDLGRHLSLTTGASSERQLQIVAEFNQRTTAFVVDGVDRIQRCRWDTFETITDSTCDSTSVIGTVRVPGEGLVIILDLETIMATIDPTMGMEHYQGEIEPAARVNRAEVRIVYCEDSTVIQRVLVRTLETAGFRHLTTFFTGEDGLEYLRKTPPHEVDVIISDIEMPKMDGLTFCKAVRSIPGFKDTPFVFFSSMINASMQRKCEGVGGNAAYSKPEIHKIVAECERLISLRQLKIS